MRAGRSNWTRYAIALLAGTEADVARPVEHQPAVALVFAGTDAYRFGRRIGGLDALGPGVSACGAGFDQIDDDGAAEIKAADGKGAAQRERDRTAVGARLGRCDVTRQQLDGSGVIRLDGPGEAHDQLAVGGFGLEPYRRRPVEHHPAVAIMWRRTDPHRFGRRRTRHPKQHQSDRRDHRAGSGRPTTRLLVRHVGQHDHIDPARHRPAGRRIEVRQLLITAVGETEGDDVLVVARRLERVRDGSGAGQRQLPV